MINRLIKWLFGGLIERKATEIVDKQLQELRLIENQFEELSKRTPRTYTTIRSFSGHNAEYYTWVNSVLNSEEYRYFIFDLRENIIREMIGMKDEKDLLKKTGQLETINVIGNYLIRYKTEYEDTISRNKKA